MRLSRSFTALIDINCGNSISWTASIAFCRSWDGIDFGQCRKWPEKSHAKWNCRYRTGPVTTELDPLRVNWKCRLWLENCRYWREKNCRKMRKNGKGNVVVRKYNTTHIKCNVNEFNSFCHLTFMSADKFWIMRFSRCSSIFSKIYKFLQ